MRRPHLFACPPACLPALALLAGLLSTPAPAQQGQPGQQAPITAQSRGGTGQATDPVPLPDVPEAVVEALEEAGVEGLRIPDSIGDPPEMGGGPAGRTGDSHMTDRTSDNALPAEALDQDREPWPGQDPAARRPADGIGLFPGQVLGAAVLGPGGEAVGQVTDLLFDPGTGRVSQALIRLAPALDEEMPVVALPWHELAATRLNGRALIGLPIGLLRSAPRHGGPAADTAEAR